MAAPSPDLVFQAAPLAGAPDLVFGQELVAAGAVTVAVAALLGGALEATATAGVPVRAVVVAKLANTLTAAGRLVYDNRVTPWRDSRAAAAHQTARAAGQSLFSGWVGSMARRGVSTVAWQLALRRGGGLAVVFESAIAQQRQSASRWQLAGQQVATAAAAHEKAIAKCAASKAHWQLSAGRGTQILQVLQTGLFKASIGQMRWELAVPQRLGLTALSGASLRLVGLQFVDSSWQTATAPSRGLSALPIPPGQPVPARFGSDLLFECPPLNGAPTGLIFGRHPCSGLPLAPSFFILPARFYMTTHNLIAHRLPDLAEVPLYDCTLSADVGSFAWQFAATGPESLFAQLAPTAGPGAALPQRLQVTLDGLVWVFVVESLKRSHSFGKRSISISGRSQTALTGAPWQREVAFSNSAPANAQQLASQVLDLSGVALDWGITDWLVPANAWSFAGSRLAALQAIANAAGGYVQSHRSAATLQVRHPYAPRPSGDSGGPWNWNIGPADIELAPDAVITSSIERRDGPDINGVYVSGTTQGVLALVKRVGSAGDKLGALQTDALLTASEAAQQRGLAVLGKAGAQYIVSLELPVLTGAGQPGVIDLGSLVQVNEPVPWRGLVRGVQVQTAMPKARQTITLERHL